MMLVDEVAMGDNIVNYVVEGNVAVGEVAARAVAVSTTGVFDVEVL